MSKPSTFVLVVGHGPDLEQEAGAAAMLRQRILLVPRTDFSRVILASAFGHLGEVDGARRIWGELKEITEPAAEICTGR